MVTRGTKEWANSNVNLYYGCSNNCSYCYAKRMALRFGRISKPSEWEIMTPNDRAINKGYSKRKGRIMFPTSHDITSDPEVRANCFIVLEKLLKAGNEVLITTKPNLTAIQAIIFKFKDFKEQCLFRFTITSKYDDILEKYETNAPTYSERKRALILAFTHGWKTSLSIEPLLDLTPLGIIDEVDKYISDTIWIGIMSGPVPDELKSVYNLENLKLIYKECSDDLHPRVRNKIRFKDSIVNKLKLESNRI